MVMDEAGRPRAELTSEMSRSCVQAIGEIRAWDCRIMINLILDSCDKADE